MSGLRRPISATAASPGVVTQLIPGAPSAKNSDISALEGADVWLYVSEWGERVRIRGAGGRWAGQLTHPAWSRIRSR